MLFWNGKNLTNEDYFQWQDFLHLYGSDDDIESNQWMEDFLRALMANTLKDKVILDFNELPKEHRGAFSVFFCMVNCMVSKNKEPHCNFKKWIQDFTISNFPGDNVTKACLCIKAFVNAIRHNKLPSDIITQILNGMSLAFTEEFCNICNT
jgi:hypothetical protein